MVTGKHVGYTPLKTVTGYDSEYNSKIKLNLNIYHNY